MLVFGVLGWSGDGGEKMKRAKNGYGFVQRKLLPGVAALAMGLCVGPAQAQSKIVVYGRLAVGVVAYSGYGEGRGAVVKESGFGSRLGLKGDEALGNDVHALFGLEAGISPDTGSGGFFAREASVGLASDLGKLRLGFMLTPLDDLHGIVGPGYLSNVTNDNLNGFWANGYNNSFAGAGGDGSTPCTQTAATAGNSNSFAFDNRYANSLRYDSPSLQGFTIASHIASGESAHNAACRSMAWSSKLQFNAPDLVAAIAYNLHHDVRGPDLDDRIVLLALGVNLGKRFNLAAYFQNLRYANLGSRALTQDGYGLRARMLQAAHTFELAWYRAGAGQGDQAPVFSGIFTGAGTQSDLTIFGYRYDLSRRSQLWAQYAMLSNGARAGYDLGGAGAAGAAGTLGQHPRAFGVGIKHDF